MSDETPTIVMFSDIVEANGRTIRENNLDIQHKYPLGSIVQVDIDLSHVGIEEGIEINLKGTCTLFVVGHNRDCDGSPLYILSDIPVEYPLNSPSFSRERLVYRTLAKLVEHGYGEESLKPTGKQLPIRKNARAWLMPEG
jgi:hypothetical protein